MGRGDKKTKKGKIFKGSYGNSRPKEGNKSTAQAEKPEAKPAKATAAKKK